MAYWVETIMEGTKYNPDSEFVPAQGELLPGQFNGVGEPKLPKITAAKWIDPDLCVKTVQLKQKIKTKSKTLPDMFSVDHGHQIVRQSFKDLVEEMEPGVHQFLPMTLLPWKDDPAPEGNFYLFNILGYCECVLMEPSDFELIPLDVDDEESPKYWSLTQYFDPHIEVSLPAIGGRHIWRSLHQLRNHFLFSEDFYQEVKRRGLNDYRYTKLVDTDKPWIAEENLTDFLIKDYQKDMALRYGNDREMIRGGAIGGLNARCS